MADAETAPPETATKATGRKPAAAKAKPVKETTTAAPASKTAARKPATAKKAAATPAKKPATAARKTATTVRKPAKAKSGTATKTTNRWPAIAGGAVAAAAAAGAAVFALRKPKTIEAAIDAVKDAAGVSDETTDAANATKA